MAQKSVLLACPACAKKVSSDAPACPGCGQPLSDQWEREGRNKLAKNNKKLMIGWLGVSGIFVALIIVGVLSAPERSEPQNVQVAIASKPTSFEKPSTASACYQEAVAVAREIGARVEQGAANGMAWLNQPNLGETTYGCSPNAFLVMFAKPEQSLNEFLDAFARVGLSLRLDKDQSIIRSQADQCIQDAKASSAGDARRQIGAFVLDCASGRGGTNNPKITIEMPKAPSRNPP